MNNWICRNHHPLIDVPLAAGLFLIFFAVLFLVLLVGCVCKVGMVVWDGGRDE